MKANGKLMTHEEFYQMVVCPLNQRQAQENQLYIDNTSRMKQEALRIEESLRSAYRRYHQEYRQQLEANQQKLEEGLSAEKLRHKAEIFRLETERQRVFAERKEDLLEDRCGLDNFKAKEGGVR